MRWVSSTDEEWSVLRLVVTTLWAPVEIAIALFIVVPFANPFVEMALKEVSTPRLAGLELHPSAPHEEA